MRYGSEQENEQGHRAEGDVWGLRRRHHPQKIEQPPAAGLALPAAAGRRSDADGRALRRGSRVVVRPQGRTVIRGTERRYVQDRRLTVRYSERRDRCDRWDERAEVLAAVACRPQAPGPRSAAVARDIKTIVVVGHECGLRVIRRGQQLGTTEWCEGGSVVGGDEKPRIRTRDQRPHVARRWKGSRHEPRYRGAADGGDQRCPGGAGIAAVEKRRPCRGGCGIA